MNEHLQQLETLSRQPSLKVSPEQHATIVGNIVHHVMHPYFLQKSPEAQEKYRTQYLAHMQAIAGYCLLEYVENSEPHLTIEFIKGLHRYLYLGLTRVQLKTPDSSEAFMVPGEFKTSPTGISRRGNAKEFLANTSPEHVARDMEMLLELLHDERTPLFQRYFRFMLDLTEIHPFPDGNGKLTALLGDLYLLKQDIQPPYFAKYKCENEEEFYELAERYSHNPQRDISIFYPVAVRAYEGLVPAAQQIRPAGKHVEWLQFQHVIKTALFPRLLTKLKNDDQADHALVKSFEQHTAVLAKFCADYFMNHDDLSIRFISDLHRMLYPPGVFIRSVRYGVPVDTLPGEFRKQTLLPDGPGCISLSSTSDIESDLAKQLEKFSGSLRSKRGGREAILEFYFALISIHPFGDSNGTIAALLCDIECFRRGVKPLNMLHLRYKDKAFLFYVVELYVKDRSGSTLGQALRAIDDFHEKATYIHAPALLEDLTQGETIAKLLQQVGVWNREQQHSLGTLYPTK
ncbi:MAG: Fic family protein [Sideroxyarcus sp.]|nr:Fic family protein [Sideroxyarcus sp.]